MDPNYQTPTQTTDTQVDAPAPTGGKTGKIKNSFRKVKNPKKYAGFLLFAVVIAVIGTGAFVYRNMNSDQVLGEQSEEAIQEENAEILVKVGKLTIVPAGEEPEIATIADTTQLDSQAFFSRAQNGDKVIIYRTAKRVILYRPSTNQVVETGPLVESAVTPVPTSVPTP